MPFSTLVLTAGISALAPRNYFGKLFRKEDSPIKFDNGQQNPVPKDPTLSEEAVFNSCLTWAAHQTSQAQQLPPEEISAEFSILYAIAKQRNALAQGALVHLIHTPTLGGRLSATIQETALETQLGVQVHRQELSVPFDPTQRGGLAMASGAFIGQISRLLRDGHPDTTAFAPIGGYKSMVALGHIAASFHGLPSLYLHEDSQVLQEIAPAPVHFSEDDRATISSTARKIGNGAQMKDLSAEQRSVVERFPSFFTRVDDLVELNELGQYIRLDQLPVRLSPEAMAEFRRDSTHLSTQLGQIRNKAAIDPDYKGINHDLTGTPGRSHPWRLAKMGSGNRIVWQHRDDEILVRKIWRDHDDYEKEVTSIVIQPVPSDLSGYQIVKV